MTIQKIENLIPFIDFSFNGIKSSSLNIKRVSSNNRYSIELTPNQLIITNNLVGSGVELSRVDMLGKQITLNIAFDSVNQEQLNKLQTLFSLNRLGELILGETPYKKLLVRCNGTLQIKYLCFLENGLRVYKGEGTLSFESVKSFYECTSPYLDDYYIYSLKDYTGSDNDFLQRSYHINFYNKKIGEGDGRLKYNESVEGSNFYFWTPISPNIPIDPTIYLYLNSNDRAIIKSISIHMELIDLTNGIGGEKTGIKSKGKFLLKNLKLLNNDKFLILNFKEFLAYGATTSDGKIIPNGNNYSQNIGLSIGNGIDKKDIPYHWNQYGTEINIERYWMGLLDNYYRPRIEVTFYKTNIPNDSNNNNELKLSPRKNPTDERPTGIYDVRYTNKVY